MAPILDTIRTLHRMGIWLEIVTLLIPGFNDSEEELQGLTGFLAGISPDIPWHVTAFHQDYKMPGPRNTAPDDLIRAAEIGAKAGLRYVYAGNLPGRVGRWEDTKCHGCGELLIQRRGYFIQAYRLTPEGACPACKSLIPGRWAAKFGGQVTDRPFVPDDGSLVQIAH
jgi:pyruvate formate lyase activating enzyme